MFDKIDATMLQLKSQTFYGKIKSFSPKNISVIKKNDVYGVYFSRKNLVASNGLRVSHYSKYREY